MSTSSAPSSSSLSATSTPAAACATCGTPLQGPYCAHCGEKQLGHHDYSMAHFLEHVVDTTTHFDFKVLKGMGDLLAHPGRMTRDVLRGSRVPWPKPLQLFLVVNLIYVFLAHRVGMQVFNTPLRFHYGNWYGELVDFMMSALARKRGITLDKLTIQFDALADTLSKTLIFAFIPLMAGVLALLLWRKRRYYLEHVVVATNLMAQILLVLLLLIGPYALLYKAATLLHINMAYEQRDKLSMVLLLAMITGFATPLLRRTYSLSFWPALLAAAACAGSFMLLLVNVYRLLLFFVIYWLL